MLSKLIEQTKIVPEEIKTYRENENFACALTVVGKAGWIYAARDEGIMAEYARDDIRLFSDFFSECMKLLESGEIDELNVFVARPQVLNVFIRRGFKIVGEGFDQFLNKQFFHLRLTRADLQKPADSENTGSEWDELLADKGR